MVFVYVAGIVPVTLKVIVQLPLAGILPLFKVTEPLVFVTVVAPGFGTIIPLLQVVLGVPVTVNPLGKLSDMVAPSRATLLGLFRVIVTVLDWVAANEAGEKALAPVTAL